MADCFGYIAYGNDDFYHLGALFGALRLLRHTPDAKIAVLTDRPEIFAGHPVETILLTERRKAEMSFDGRYHFGIKAAGLQDLLERCNRLFFMDTDMYATGDMSGAFRRITPDHSIMRMSEGRAEGAYAALAGCGIAVGDHELDGSETMWNSGILGAHHANLPLLKAAHAAMESVSRVVKVHTPEQFCIGVALHQGGRSVGPHRMPIRNYSTSDKKQFARERILAFFRDFADSDLETRKRAAAELRLWRSPVDLIRQKALRRAG